jgi:hypothetical protein
MAAALTVGLLHFFQQCPRIADLWEGLYARRVTLVPGLPSDVELPMLAFPVAVERVVVAHVAILVAELWESRSCLRQSPGVTWLSPSESTSRP